MVGVVPQALTVTVTMVKHHPRQREKEQESNILATTVAEPPRMVVELEVHSATLLAMGDKGSPNHSKTVPLV